jgi:ribonuclease D
MNMFSFKSSRRWFLIDSLDLLQAVCGKLETLEEYVVHMHCSPYSGTTVITLLVITTRTEDFIIDVINLLPQVCLLQSALANPASVKIIYASDLELAALQQLGISIVNTFNICCAARILGRYFSLFLPFLKDQIS